MEAVFHSVCDRDVDLRKDSTEVYIEAETKSSRVVFSRDVIQPGQSFSIRVTRPGVKVIAFIIITMVIKIVF